MALPSLILRTTKGSALTYAEADANFTNLSTATTKVLVGSTTTTLALNDTLTLAAGANVTLTADSTSKTVTIASAAGGMTDIVTDTTPQLGGDLDVNGKKIVSTSNAAIYIEPNGTGDVYLTADQIVVGDLNANATITTYGSGNLILNTDSGNSSGSITIPVGANQNISISPNGTGRVVLDANQWPATDGTNGQTIITDGTGNLKWVNTYTYTLTTATAAAVGGIKIGSGLTAVGDGTTSVNWETPGTIGSTTANTGAFTTLSATAAGTSGALTVSYNPSSPSGSAIQATGKDSQGGVGYFDFLKTTNSTSGATNANKTFRMTSTGALEVVNSAYGAVIFSLTDAGALTVGGNTYPTTSGTNGQVLTTNGTGGLSWTTVSGGASNGVQSISFGSTGLTPATATTGTVTVGGVLNVANGGLGTSEVAGIGRIPIGNGSNYVPAFLTAGANITITTSSGAITIAASGGSSGDTVYTGGNITGSYTPSISSGTIHTYTLTGNVTINSITSISTGQTITLILTQDGTGSRTLTSTMKFANGYKTLSVGASTTDMVSITYVGGNYYATLVKGYA